VAVVVERRMMEKTASLQAAEAAASVWVVDAAVVCFRAIEAVMAALGAGLGAVEAAAAGLPTVEAAGASLCTLEAVEESLWMVEAAAAAVVWTVKATAGLQEVGTAAAGLRMVGVAAAVIWTVEATVGLQVVTAAVSEPMWMPMRTTCWMMMKIPAMSTVIRQVAVNVDREGLGACSWRTWMTSSPCPFWDLKPHAPRATSTTCAS